MLPYKFIRLLALCCLGLLLVGFYFAVGFSGLVLVSVVVLVVMWASKLSAADEGLIVRHSLASYGFFNRSTVDLPNYAEHFYNGESPVDLPSPDECMSNDLSSLTP
jgi:hypothetical protein